MPIAQSDYDFISSKISSLKDAYPSLRGKPDDYVFSALAVKSNYYKNPALVLNDADFDDLIVDGQYDGGVDVLLSDPNTETSDLVIGQSKYYRSISNEDVFNALTKMASFYKDMKSGHYEQVNAKVQSRFLSLDSEVGEESKIQFVFYTSAPQNNIRRDRLKKKFLELFEDSNNFEVYIYFGPDVVAEIKESESRRPTVESGKILIDEANNYLVYGDNAAFVNASAFSIKSLYAQHNTNLLSRNLRYHVSGRQIDKGIEDTINNSPETFWVKNNGITIVCDEFTIDGREVKLKNFSIVNGGQTTYMIHKNKNVCESRDFYVPCKIIENDGETEDEKNLFSLEIAKATNSQKAIKPIDLKANSPEQVRFSQAMREVGLFYQTKRGETVPAAFRTTYLNTDLAEIGKLCLSAIFQMPGTSRNKPSSIYLPQYYDIIFNGNQSVISKFSKELLYIDFYFRKGFQNRFDSENRNRPNAQDRIAFAHNSRTICIAFTALASRYHQGNIDNDDLADIFSASRHDPPYSQVYEDCKDIGELTYLINPTVFADKNAYDEVLYELFMLIINAGINYYSMMARFEEGLIISNFLKKDRNYYGILESGWDISLNNGIKKIFDNLTT